MGKLYQRGCGSRLEKLQAINRLGIT